MVCDLADLELSPEEMRAMGAATLARVVDHLTTLEEQPSMGDLDAEGFCRSLREPAPEEPTALEPLLRLLFDECVPRSFTTSGPGYLAFVPGGGLFPAALADLIADTTNRFTGMWRTAPALVQLEANVLAWFAEWMQFPASASGLLTTGGSMASFNAVVAAREKLCGPELRRGVMYASTEVHHAVVKVARLAGVLPDRVRLLPAREDFTLDPALVEEAVVEDRRRGLLPFLVVSSAGTVNTGAVDPLDAIADLCQRHGLWHHVDGAYGAFFHLCPELRGLLRGLPRADSLTLDPHKGLFLPYGTGALLVRDGAALRAVHAARAGYLPDVPEPEFYDPSQHGPDLSRGFPGLRVWLSVKLFGAGKLRAAVAEKRALALDAAARVGGIPGVVMVAPPSLSLFAFHLSWPGATLADENQATQLLLERVCARRRVMLTGCTVRGRLLARVCVLSFRTRQRHLDTCVEQVAEETAAILAGR